MISLLKKKHRIISMLVVASFLAVIVGCAEHDTMTKDEEMKHDSSGTMKKEGSGSSRY